MSDATKNHAIDCQPQYVSEWRVGRPTKGYWSFDPCDDCRRAMWSAPAAAGGEADAISVTARDDAKEGAA